jgi:hypothetical protein
VTPSCAPKFHVDGINRLRRIIQFNFSWDIETLHQGSWTLSITIIVPRDRIATSVFGALCPTHTDSLDRLSRGSAITFPNLGRSTAMSTSATLSTLEAAGEVPEQLEFATESIPVDPHVAAAMAAMAVIKLNSSRRRPSPESLRAMLGTIKSRIDALNNLALVVSIDSSSTYNFFYVISIRTVSRAILLLQCKRR